MLDTVWTVWGESSHLYLYSYLVASSVSSSYQTKDGDDPGAGSPNGLEGTQSKKETLAIFCH